MSLIQDQDAFSPLPVAQTKIPNPAIAGSIKSSSVRDTGQLSALGQATALKAGVSKM